MEMDHPALQVVQLWIAAAGDEGWIYLLLSVSQRDGSFIMAHEAGLEAPRTKLPLCSWVTAVALDGGLSSDAGRPCARVAYVHSGVLGAKHPRQPPRLGTCSKGCKLVLHPCLWIVSSLVLRNQNKIASL